MLFIGNLSQEETIWGGLVFQPTEIREIGSSDLQAIQTDVALGIAILSGIASVVIDNTQVTEKIDALREVLSYSPPI